MTYFDNAATTYPKPKEVYENTMKLYSEIGINSSRGKYSKADEMNEITMQLRMNIAAIAGVKYDENIILTPSATVALNQIIQGIDYSLIKNVYISPFEHNAVYRTILAMKDKYNFELSYIPFDSFEWNKSKTEIFFNSQQPNLIILTNASNVFGNILPVEEIFELGKKYNAITVLDAAQTFGLIELKLNKIIDFMVFAGHKTLYGTSGIGGFIYNNKNIRLSPILFGGTGINSEEKKMPDSIPERFEAGSHNILGIIGLKISTDWVLNTGIKEINNKEKENYEKLIKILERYEDMQIFKSERTVGIVSCKFKRFSPGEIGEIFNEYGIAVRTGLHCSPIAHKFIGTQLDGTVRFSVGYFNSDEDFENLEECLDEIL